MMKMHLSHQVHKTYLIWTKMPKVLIFSVILANLTMIFKIYQLRKGAHQHGKNCSKWTMYEVHHYGFLDLHLRWALAMLCKNGHGSQLPFYGCPANLKRIPRQSGKMAQKEANYIVQLLYLLYLIPYIQITV